MNDEARGLAALREFFNYSATRFGASFPYSSFDQFYAAVKKTKGSTFLADGLGTAININEMSDDKVRRAMFAIANAGGGKLPATQSGWFNALVNESTQISFLEATTFVATETAATVVDGAKEIGDAVIDTGKSFLAIGPLALLAAGLFILYRKAKTI